jgi:molybdate transport system substrate-binding protein
MEVLSMSKSVKSYRMLILFMLGVLFACTVAMAEASKPTLFAYVGAGLKDPVTELSAMYEQKTGVKVEMTFNNVGGLYSQLELSKKGDIFIPGGMPFLAKAKQAGYILEMAGPLAYHVPVIITPKGNPAKISSVVDLAKPGVKLVLPDTKATAIGASALKVFNKLGISKEIEKNTLALMETPMKVTAALLMGQGDAGIVEYSDAVKNSAKLEMIMIDPSQNSIDEIPCAVLSFSSQKDAAEAFMEFAKTEGPAVFAKYGFKTKL